MSSPKHALLLYDGDCPFCSEVSSYYKLRAALPNLEIVSLRDTDKVKPLQIPADIDFNLGMVLILEDHPDSRRILQGEEALYYISQSFEAQNPTDHLLRSFGSKRWISKLSYPIFFLLRKLYYKLRLRSAHIPRKDLSLILFLVGVNLLLAPNSWSMGSETPDCKINQTQEQLQTHRRNSSTSF